MIKFILKTLERLIYWHLQNEHLQNRLGQLLNTINSDPVCYFKELSLLSPCYFKELSLLSLYHARITYFPFYPHSYKLMGQAQKIIVYLTNMKYNLSQDMN